mgnify:CR=1 FL=1
MFALGAATFTYLYEFSFEESLDHLAELGFSYIELMTTPPHFFPRDMSTTQRSETRRAFESRKLNLYSLQPTYMDLNIISNNPPIRNESIKQVQENIESADNSGVGSLIKKKKKMIQQAANKYKELIPVNCTGCGYCIPCPAGVRIPKVFSLYNEAEIFDSKAEKQQKYNKLAENEQASSCVECGKCEEICPQNLDIITKLATANKYLTT